MRHLWWLRDAGVREVPLAPRAAPGRGRRPLPRRRHAYALSDKGCGSEPLLAIRAGLGECTRCKLHGGRTRLVFGVGNPSARADVRRRGARAPTRTCRASPSSAGPGSCSRR